MIYMIIWLIIGAVVFGLCLRSILNDNKAVKEYYEKKVDELPKNLKM